MCPHRPSQDPSPLEARAILAPLGPLPVSPPPSPSPVAKASEIQPCAGNAVPSLGSRAYSIAPQATPGSVATSNSICSGI